MIGYAKAETPLLEKPLEGPVYLRSSGHKLPDIVAALKGQIDIDLDGHVDTVHDGLRTTFETVPDAPVSKFTLSLDGGNKGLLKTAPTSAKHRRSRRSASPLKTVSPPIRIRNCRRPAARATAASATPGVSGWWVSQCTAGTQGQ